MHELGQTRSEQQRDHLLLTPDSFVRITLPTIERGTAIVHVSPAAGAGFAQYTAELDAGGSLAPAEYQRFLYVLEGGVDLASASSFHSLGSGGYAYLPAGAPHSVTTQMPSRLAVIEKPYRTLPGVEPASLLIGEESAVLSTALQGDVDVQVRQLLPDRPAFDFAVNTMTYRPGASLSQVEAHVMEHGLLMLEGGGIYRLGERWHAVRAGDFIWMAPFCPQWFGALGKRPAKYLIYKDTQRPPL
ncbi:MAG: (S)-ureidoglycine aminohydrolase [Acidobacteriota bacterium]|nr:(S)-ureidoglycine aminohydrolase [Acidobacteriota bacterium]